MTKTKESPLDVVPQEIIEEIVSCSTVKDVLRFKCVSHDWRSFISTARFATLYMHRSLSHYRVLAPFFENPNRIVVKDCPLDRLFSQVDTYPNDLGSPFGFVNEFTIIGIANGLVCVRFNFNSLLMLWNPGTKKFKKLDALHKDDPITKVGFRYDESNGDYKLHVAFSGYNPYTRKSKGGTAKTFSLKQNRWGEGWTFEEFEYFGPLHGYLVGDRLYWGYRDIIFYLDFKEKKRGFLDEPVDEDGKCIEAELGLSHGLLSMVRKVSLGPHNFQIDLWTYGDEWSKWISIPFDLIPRTQSHFPTPVSMLFTDGDRILFNYGDSLLIYSRSRAQFSYAPLKNFTDFRSVHIYTDSLASVDFDVEEFEDNALGQDLSRLPKEPTEFPGLREACSQGL